MGRQRDSKLVGTFGNVIFYNFRGEYCMRTKPVSVKRTRASVSSGLNFGKASKISAQIRKVVAPINPAQSDMRVLYRLTAALNKFITWKEKKDAASIKMPDKLPFISGFQFNDQADLSSIFAIRPSVKSPYQGLTEISFTPLVPSQSLQAPSNTNSILFKMILLGVSLDNAETDTPGKAEIEIPYSDEPFQPPVISIPATSKPEALVILVMAVQYMVYKNSEVELLNDKRKMPCGIVWTRNG
jgi:hypothetical protein